MNNTLSHIEIDILKYLDANVDITRSEAFQLFLASDYSLNNLLENGYIHLLSAPKGSTEHFTLTSKGISYINDYKIFMSEQTKELQRIKKDALFSKIVAILALLISIVSIFTQVLF